MNPDQEWEQLKELIRSLGIPDAEEISRTANLPSAAEMLARAKEAECRNAAGTNQRS